MMVTGGIPAAFHVQLIVCPLLRVVSGYVAFSLLADYITDNPLFTFEIITDGICFIRSFPILEYRSSLLHA